MVDELRLRAPAVPRAEPPLVARRGTTQAEIDALSPAVLARLLYDWQAESDDRIVVSVRAVVEYVRGLRLTPGRVERFTGALARLEEVGVLERIADHPTAARRLVELNWADVERRLGGVSHAVSRAVLPPLGPSGNTYGHSG